MALFDKILVLTAIFTCLIIHKVSTEEVFTGIKDAPSPHLLFPKIMIGLLVRNKAHTLPYFFHYLENLDYPKERIILWIKSDHNIDNSTEIVQEWLRHTKDQYHKVYAYVDDIENDYEDAQGECDWSKERFTNIIQLRQEILDTARGLWADYVFFVDVDNILVNKDTLKLLVAQRKTIVAPLLNNTVSEWYSNFWGGVDESGYYKRSSDYEAILKRQTKGCFTVANVHSTFLINLNFEESQLLSFDTPPPEYKGPYDDIIIFASVAKYNKVPVHVLNSHFFGWMPVPMEAHNVLSQEVDQFVHILIENIIYDRPLQKLPYIYVPMPEPTTLGYDEIYMINLKRRPDRREKMLACFKLLGIKAKLIDAVDGKELNDTYLQELGVKMLSGYADPYHGRQLTMGEIGCYLSHYFIWQDIVDNKHMTALILEDDVRFGVYFIQKHAIVLNQLSRITSNWDLLYLGRKKLKYQEETWVEGSDVLVFAHYSYWTLSYALTLSGAQKLLSNDPLSKMLPVDEYIPIKFDRHPTSEWLMAFEPRDIIGLSAEPLLVYPTHYTGEPGYLTDTEDSSLLDADETASRGDRSEL